MTVRRLSVYFVCISIDVIDVDVPLAKEAARFRAAYSISYADCFAAALARDRKAELITGDPEFKKLDNEITVCWI